MVVPIFIYGKEGNIFGKLDIELLKTDDPFELVISQVLWDACEVLIIESVLLSMLLLCFGKIKALIFYVV